MAAKHRQGRPRVHVPDPHRAVALGNNRRLTTEGGQPATARGECHPDHATRVAEQGRHVLPARRPPHPDGPVPPRRGDPLPVWAVGGGEDLARMAVVGRFDLPAGRGVPLPCRPVRRGRYQARAVRAERGADDLAGVPPAGRQQRAGGRVPKARRPVFAARDEPRAVRAEGVGPDAVAVAVADRRLLAGRRVEHQQPNPLAVRPDARQPRAVRAHGNGPRPLRPRHRHSTNDLAGLTQQVKGRFPEPTPRLVSPRRVCATVTNRRRSMPIGRLRSSPPSRSVNAQAGARH